MTRLALLLPLILTGCGLSQVDPFVFDHAKAPRSHQHRFRRAVVAVQRSPFDGT